MCVSRDLKAAMSFIRFLTVSIAVVGVCDTPETLLSSSVPYLPEQEDISNIIIKYLMPPKFHPDVAAKC